jgi:hypothetical protein
MKLAAFVVLGIIVSFVVFELLLFWILSAFPDMGGCGDLWVPILILMPVSFLVGGIVTGFLSCPILNSKWGFLGIAPGLYSTLLFMCSPFLNGGGLGYFLLFGLYWYLASLAGVALGYFLRALIRRFRRSD